MRLSLVSSFLVMLSNRTGASDLEAERDKKLGGFGYGKRKREMYAYSDDEVDGAALCFMIVVRKAVELLKTPESV